MKTLNWRFAYFRGVSILLLSFFQQYHPVSAFADGCMGDLIPGQYLVRFHEEVMLSANRAGQISSIMKMLNVDEIAYEYKIISGLVLVKSANINLRSAKSLIKSGAVRYIVPNCRFQAVLPSSSYTLPTQPSNITRSAPNDSLFSSQWAHVNGSYDLDTLEAWDFTRGSRDVVIGVVDTGVDYNHEDLSANMWVNPNEISGNGIDDDGNGYIDDVHGINAIAGTGNPLDDHGHGTMVSGILGAVGNNALGVVGVNWNVSILAIKVIDSHGKIDFADAIKGFEYAIALKNAGVNIVALNNSWGGYSNAPSQLLVDSISALNDAQILLVAGAGNDSSNNDTNPFYPAGVEVANVISVAAIDETGALASFSNYGATTVDVAAPGQNIKTTIQPNTYAFTYGTSMATPFVSGLAGLIASRESNLTAVQMKERIMSTVRSVKALNGKMVSPGVINAYNAVKAGKEGSACDVGTTPFLPPGDTDGDGVPDAQEVTDGTNQHDPGSFKVKLKSPVYALWNGFLGMTNILEMVNTGDSKLSAKIALFSIDGLDCKQIAVSIPAQGQQDIVLNTMQNFMINSYGLLRITYRGSTLDGRVAYYRPASSSGVAKGNGFYDFVYGIPLSNPLYGNSAVSFNTYWPGTNPAEFSNLVANWVSIVNLSDSTTRFSVTRYSVNGAKLSSSSYQVQAKSRIDIEAGHINPGQNNVGSHVIKPSNATSPYLALITRYGHNAPPSGNTTGYEFAFPMVAKAGSGENLIAPLTTTVGAQNWLEVINATDSVENVAVSFYSSDGVLEYKDSTSIKAHAQVHFNANSSLGDDKTGFAVIVPSSANSIIAQSMVYIRNPSSGFMLGMYGSQARESSLGNVVGSYNLYLGMYNWLKIINPSSSGIRVGLTVNLPNGTPTLRELPIGAWSSLDLGLHDNATYGTTANSYGVVRVEVSGSEHIFSELIRIKVDPTSQNIDFAMPTEVR